MHLSKLDLTFLLISGDIQRLSEIDLHNANRRRCGIAGRRTFRTATRVAFGQRAERRDRDTGVIRLETIIILKVDSC
jgi:hypothetical protein